MEFKVYGDAAVYHGFIRDDPSLLLISRPFELKVSNSLDYSIIKHAVIKET